jgi:hypothetical protein
MSAVPTPVRDAAVALVARTAASSKVPPRVQDPVSLALIAELLRPVNANGGTNE